MPQASDSGVVTAGWSNVTPYQTINNQYSWSPIFANSYEIIDDTWTSNYLGSNTQIGGSQIPAGQTASIQQGVPLSNAGA